jgi:hypothetical protein
MRNIARWFGVAALAFVFACGNGNKADDDNGDGGGNGDGNVGDDGGSGNGDGGSIDASGPAGCTPGGPQCNNCIDDDGDGRIDGADVECTGALDNDESSFATGIPGDNIDTVHQDCFFDGNSGGGNDGCNIHVCCLLGAVDQAHCPFGANQYDPADCNTPQTQQCITTCGALTPPGCDCFGCCTVCDPTTNVCYDIITNPATAPNCDETTISDPAACPRCTPRTDCGSPCGPEGCILCPGQTPDDLPAECNGMSECPTGQQVCNATAPCPSGQYCTAGCCIDGVP